MSKIGKWLGEHWLFIVLYIIVPLMVIGFIALEITVWALYGGESIDEVPVWALILMFGGGHR